MATPVEHIVTVRPRTILLVLAISVLVGLVLVLVYLAWHVVTWILIAVLLAEAQLHVPPEYPTHGLDGSAVNGMDDPSTPDRRVEPDGK